MIGFALNLFAQAHALHEQQRMQKRLYEYHKESYRRTIPQYRGWLTVIDEPEPSHAAPLLLEDHRKVD